jgi:hypothetical protein
METPGERSDAELLVIYAAFDPSNVTKSKLSSRIGRLLKAFRQQVEPIGAKDHSESLMSGTKTFKTGRLVAIDFGDGAPVLVQVTETTNVHAKPEYEMNCFVSPEMGPLAIARAESTQQPKGLVTYRYGELPIKGLVPPPEWIGHVARLE